jgi:hypothetical protein
MDSENWADESWTYTVTDVYNWDPSQMIVHKISPKSEIDLGDAYYNWNIQIVKYRLIAAGIRLGTLLNNILQ